MNLIHLISLLMMAYPFGIVSRRHKLCKLKWLKEHYTDTHTHTHKHGTEHGKAAILIAHFPSFCWCPAHELSCFLNKPAVTHGHGCGASPIPFPSSTLQLSASRHTYSALQSSAFSSEQKKITNVVGTRDRTRKVVVALYHSIFSQLISSIQSKKVISVRIYLYQ